MASGHGLSEGTYRLFAPDVEGQQYARVDDHASHGDKRQHAARACRMAHNALIRS